MLSQKIALFRPTSQESSHTFPTFPRRIPFIIDGVWLSHSAYDARMVKMAVGIVLESVNHDMTDLGVPNFILLSQSTLYRGREK